MGLISVRGSGLDLTAYSDADYADKSNDRRSVSGTAITLGGAAVSWASSTQTCVTLSTAEAEYVALGEGVKEALFTGAVLSFICPELTGSCVRVFEDNQGAIALAENPLSSARSKHIDVRFHFVRELLRAEKIDIQFVASEEQHADILTKSLAATPFKSHHDRFNENRPRIAPHGALGSSLPSKALVVGVTLAAGGLFGLFQLRLLPKSWGPWVSKMYFWPTLPFTMIRAFDNYWTKMDDTVFLGAAPVGFLGHVDEMHAKGVVGVINMCGEYRGPLEDYKRLGIEELWLPTVDHEEPELEDYERGVAFIKRWHNKGGKVLVHCKAGHGRSSAIVMAWLLANNPSTTPREVQREMLSRRRVRGYLYKQLNLRLYYRGLQIAADGSGKERDRAPR
eukprot:jgi/Undpi1/3916/HiC_scaffold_16.g07284.m1